MNGFIVIGSGLIKGIPKAETGSLSESSSDIVDLTDLDDGKRLGNAVPRRDISRIRRNTLESTRLETDV